MRILIAASIYPPDTGGPATHARAQYEWFTKEGHKTGLIVLAHYRKYPRFFRHLIYFFKLVREIPRYDVVYAHDILGVGWPAFIAARLFGKKILVRIGGDIPWEREAQSNRTRFSMCEWYEAGKHKKNKFFRFSLFLMHCVDAVVVTTSLLGDLYMKYYGLPKDRLHIIPNPVEERRVLSSEDGSDIIYASRLVKYKNLNFVIQAFAEILPETNARFIIMGDGPERKTLESLVESLSLNEKILFKGNVSQEEVREATRKCLFGLAPALTEFNPNYIMECISFGKSFLISRENGLPFPVPEELLFNARDKEEFKRKVKNLLSREGRKMGQDRVKNIHFHISWEEVLMKNLEIIELLLKGQK